MICNNCGIKTDCDTYNAIQEIITIAMVNLPECLSENIDKVFDEISFCEWKT